MLIILSYPWDDLKTQNVLILLTFGGYQNLVLWRTITKSSLSPPWSQSGIHWTENSYEIEMDFRNFRNFDALWTTGMSEQVNNITLPIANRSKLPLGCFKIKKCIGIINIWWVPKCGFVTNNHENFLLPPDPNQWALVENSYEIRMDLRNFQNFDALWTTEMWKLVNNIALHIANHPRLPVGCFKNKKCNNIINIWWVPKFSFVTSNHENFPLSPLIPITERWQRIPMKFRWIYGISDFRRTMDHGDV